MGASLFRRASTCAVIGALIAAPARAAEIGPEEGPLTVDVHAFASQGFLFTVNNDYIDPNTTHGSFKFSEVGINFSKAFLADKLRMGIQVFAQDLGPAGNFDAKMDWFYLDYHWQDWLGIRVGRLKIPYGFYNEVNDIDSARVPILLPQSVYPLQARNFLFAQNGGEIHGFARARGVGAVDYRLFAGTIFIDPATVVPPGDPIQITFNVPYVVGGRLVWESPLDGLRFAGTFEALHLDATAYLGPMTSVSLPNDSFFWLASADYSLYDLSLTAEYGQGHSSQGTSNAMIQPPISNTSEGGYIMGAYRLTPWFQPGAYYSFLFPNIHNRDGRANRQHDVALTLRFDLNDHWLIKLEGHYMAGTAGLESPLSVNATPAASANPYWAAFLAKTTVYF